MNTLIARHPFSSRRELNTRSVRERNDWIETARGYAIDADFWRLRCIERCERDGHILTPTTDNSGSYCTCCGYTINEEPA